jgi:transposase
LTLAAFVSSSREAAVISEEELMDIRSLARQGYIYAEIGRLLGRDWRTVKRYLESGAQPVYRRRRMPSELDEFKPLIDEWLAADTAPAGDADPSGPGARLWVCGQLQHGAPLPRAFPAAARAAGVRSAFETAPGFQAQVDWSHEQPVRTPLGLDLPLFCFHMVLGHSRDSFCRLTGSQDLVTFWACQRAAFQHIGGVPRELLFDRTKTIVRAHVGRERSLGQNVFHPEALASARHSGFSIRPVQGLPAADQGQVESGVPYVRERLPRAHSFTGHEHANDAWASWNEDVARQRVHGTHGEVVAVRADRDRAALGPLPPTP